MTATPGFVKRFIVVFIVSILSISNSYALEGGLDNQYKGIYETDAESLEGDSHLPYKIELIGNYQQKSNGQWVIEMFFIYPSTKFQVKANYSERLIQDSITINSDLVKFNFEIRETPDNTLYLKTRFTIFKGKTNTVVKTTDLYYYMAAAASSNGGANENTVSLAQTQLYWIFMTILQLSNQDELFINQPISFQIQKEQTVITVTRLKDPAPDYWTIKAELFVNNRLQDSMEAAGYFGDEGLLLFSLINKAEKFFFSVNDAGEPLLLKSMFFSGAGKNYLHLNADKNQKLKYINTSDDFPTGNLIENIYKGDGYTVTIISKDKSMGRILYKIRIQGEKNKIDFTFDRIE